MRYERENEMFKSNESGADRIIRVIIGVALIAAYFAFPNLLGSYNWLLLIGIVPLATGLVGWCAIYAILGLSTRNKKHG